jgi:L-asparaginase/Glu-tRNA(Gln) amidotransferase subunit D
MKLYRNDEYGFEFWYPETWRIELNTFGNPNSKFNLVAYEGNTPPDFNPLLVNVVTPEFVKNEYSANDEKTTKVTVNGTGGTIYEYDEETHYIDYVIPRGGVDIIISNANSDHVSEFQKIVSSFAFNK